MIAGARVVVLDDDPTGTQSAADVTALLRYDEQTLVDVLRHERSVYLQTNSRALTETAAVLLAKRIRTLGEAAGERLGVDVRFVLRGDSTLRGHVFAESQVFLDDRAVMVFVPAFPLGGRITRDGTHLVGRAGSWMPVAETEFARDPVFAFHSSRLDDYVRERSGRTAIPVRRNAVRSGGLAAAILSAPECSVIVPDAEDDDDIASVAAAIESAWVERPVVVRSAAPLAARLAGVASAGPLDPTSWPRAERTLVVCGSHTEGARAQVTRLAEAVGEPTQISTAAALLDAEGEGERAARRELELERPSGVRFVATERDRLGDHDSLEHGAAVMTALAVAARELALGCDAVVTKGGITASEVIGRALGGDRARVLGQVRAGISVWLVGEAEHPRVCVIVPGNLGDEATLLDAVGWVAGG